MLIRNLIGKRITDIWVKYWQEDNWINYGECYIQLDNQEIIKIPYSNSESSCEVRIIELYKDAESIFVELLDENKSFQDMWGRKRIQLLKSIKDQKIADIISFKEDFDRKAFIELENGYLISEIISSPDGAGNEGLNIYESIQQVIEEEESEEDFNRVTKQLND